MQGYVTLATDLPKYVDMAANLARSVKVMDPARPICLIHDGKVPLTAEVAALFDDLVVIPKDAQYVGVMNKLQLYELSPYDETMFIDGDCLVVKSNMDAHWAAVAPSDFMVAGERVRSGRWKHFEIADIVRHYGLSDLLVMNNGVFFWRKGHAAFQVFQRMRDLLETEKHVLGYVHQGRVDQLSSEPFFAVAMSQLGIDPINPPAEAGSWMVTTWRARNCRFDPDRDISVIEKPTGYYFGLPLVAKGWNRLSPTVAHFIKLRPADTYAALNRHFAARLADKRLRNAA